MIGLTGPRGVGKTTLVLQHIKEELDRNKALYVTAEDFYFASHKLVDLVDSFAKLGGKYLFIDEIHKVGSINSIFYFLHKAAEPFNCLEQDNLA